MEGYPLAGHQSSDNFCLPWQLRNDSGKKDLASRAALPQIHPAKDVQQAERQIEGENNQLDSGGPKKKRDLKAERRKRQAERRLQRKNTHRVRQSKATASKRRSARH